MGSFFKSGVSFEINSSTDLEITPTSGSSNIMLSKEDIEEGKIYFKSNSSAFGTSGDLLFQVYDVNSNTVIETDLTSTDISPATLSIKITGAPQSADQQVREAQRSAEFEVLTGHASGWSEIKTNILELRSNGKRVFQLNEEQVFSFLQEEHSFDGGNTKVKLTESNVYGITNFNDETEVNAKLAAFKAGLASDGTIYKLLKAESDSNMQKLSSAFGSDIDTSELDENQVKLLETASANIQSGLNALFTEEEITAEKLQEYKSDAEALKEFVVDGEVIKMDDNFKAVMTNIKEGIEAGMLRLKT